MSEVKRPVVFADRLLVLVQKVQTELIAMEHIVLRMEEVFNEDNDMQNLGHIMNRLQSMAEMLASGYLLGDEAVKQINTDVLEPFRDLIDRMITTRSFPELEILDNFC